MLAGAPSGSLVQVSDNPGAEIAIIIGRCAVVGDGGADRSTSPRAAEPTMDRLYDLLPPPIVEQILGMMVVDVRQVVVLATLARNWHRYVSNHKSWQGLLECHARKLLTRLAAKHHSLNGVAPYQVHDFMKIWFEAQFPEGIPCSAWRPATVPPASCYAARSAYVEAKLRLSGSDEVLHKALTLRRLVLWMDHDDALMDKVNAVTVFLLVPQGLFWLALYADRSVDWAEAVGRACGLAACVGGAACTVCAALGQSRVIFLKRVLRRELRTKSETTKPALLKDRGEGLNLYRCACWACVIVLATWWLLFGAPVQLLLVGAAFAGTLLSVLGASMWFLLNKTQGPFPLIFKIWFVHVWALTPFFFALAIAHSASGRWKLMSVIVAAAPPALVLCGDVVMLVGWRTRKTCCGLAEAFQFLLALSVLLLLLLALVVACGRSIGAQWAQAMPLIALSSPLQLPFLAFVAVGGWFLFLYSVMVCCRAAQRILKYLAKVCVSRHSTDVPTPDHQVHVP